MADQQRVINPWLIAVSVMFATFMEVLDTTVVNVSLPHIAGSLSATIDEATWALTSYLVANAIILPMTGWLAEPLRPQAPADAVGRRLHRAPRSSAGWRPTLGSLIFFRIIQGATGGALQPLSQAVLLEAFPPQDRGKAMGFWGLGIVVAPILGPVLGGWLTDNYSWRWVFYINIPVGIASIVMTKLFIFDPPYLRQEIAPDRLLGHRHAGRRHRRAADRARQGTGGRLVLVERDHDAGGRRRRHARRAHRPRADDRRSGRRSARLQGAQLRRRRVPDDGASASCSTAAWCCCRSCCRRCSAIRRCRPASRWRRAASARSS